eukprot:6018505-Lingulodinium_polyedra.AAC.1
MERFACSQYSVAFGKRERKWTALRSFSGQPQLSSFKASVCSTPSAANTVSLLMGRPSSVARSLQPLRKVISISTSSGCVPM